MSAVGTVGRAGTSSTESTADASPGAPGRSTLDGAPPVVRDVPPATVGRLPLYLRALQALHDQGVVTTSSRALAAMAGVGPAQLRKDLSHLGSHGTKGVGYDVAHLGRQITLALGLTSQRRVVIIGVGHLGHALANYSGFAGRDFAVVGLVDADPAVVGTTVAGLPVQPADRLEDVVTGTGATIAVIATPAEVAQDVCDRAVAAGVSGVLCFAPRSLRVPSDVDLRAVDLGSELQILAFHDRRKRRGHEPADVLAVLSAEP